MKYFIKFLSYDYHQVHECFLMLYTFIKANLPTKPRNASQPESIASLKSYLVDMLKFHLFLQHSLLCTEWPP